VNRNVPKAVISLGLALTCLGAAEACARETPQDESVIYSRAGDAVVASAQADAQKSLPLFWSKFDAKAPGYADFKLKVSLPTDDGHGTERLWMLVLSRTADHQVIGRLANRPVRLKKLALGSTIEVDPSRIADWSYEKNGKQYGNFTTRALFPRASPQQRVEAQAMLSPTPLESETH
jgi:uncharacterized protein YegJ (DUF2314 family)